MKPESPKSRFLKSGHAKACEDIITNPAFIAAADAAMIELSDRLGGAQDGNTAAARHFMLEGARAYRMVLFRMPDKPEPQNRKLGDNLPNQDAS